jgi:hypothetical protein
LAATATAATATRVTAFGGTIARGRRRLRFRSVLIRTLLGSDRRFYAIADVVGGKFGGVTAVE